MDLDSNNYKFLLNLFGKDTIISRYSWIYSLIDDFIKHEKIADKVRLCDTLINHIIIDYFTDIQRLKEFHNIETTHESKIYAYLTYWILKRKPIQILVDEEELSFINEKFCAEFIRTYLFRNPDNVPIINSQKEKIDNFLGTLEYFFRYREYTAQNIELMLLSFEAGKSYQLCDNPNYK